MKKNYSSETQSTRLFPKDNLYIKRKVKELRHFDKRFESNGAAVRYYVKLGIATESRIESAKDTFDDKVIKASQKEVVTDSLLPLKTTIDGLIDAMREFGKKQNDFFTESNRELGALSRKIEAGFENVSLLFSESFKNITGEIMRTGKIGEESLRNIVVLRSILYLFLITYKVGRIDPDYRTQWEALVLFAHQQANELSIEELQHLAEGTLEKDVVQNLAGKMFKAIRQLQRNLPQF